MPGINIDNRLMNAGNLDSKRQKDAEEADKQRQREMAYGHELKQQRIEQMASVDKERQEGGGNKQNSESPTNKIGKLAVNKIINIFFPEYAAAKSLVLLTLGKKNESSFLDKIIFYYSLLSRFLMFIGALGIIAVIIYWGSNPFQAIWDISSGAVKIIHDALKGFF